MATIDNKLEHKLENWVIKQLETRDWSQRTLASRAGISHTQVSKILAGNRAVNFDFVMAISKAFGEPQEKLLRLAGLLPAALEPEDEVSSREIWEAIKAMSPERRAQAEELILFLYQKDQDDRQQVKTVDPGLDAV